MARLLLLRTSVYVALLGVMLEQVEVKLPVSFEVLATAHGTFQAGRFGFGQIERVRAAGGVLDRHFENTSHNFLRREEDFPQL